MNFMASYGIKTSSEGFEEARQLIDQLREASGEGKSPYRG
jgi:signal transduction histidine kinase